MFLFIRSVVLPMLLPFVLYLGLYLIKRKIYGIPEKTPYPVRRLLVAGMILTSVFLAIFSEPERAPANSKYTPPKFVNGQVVPARLDTKNAD